MGLNGLVQVLLAGITVGAVYGLVGLGYVTIYRCSGVVNFAQGDFVMLGAILTMHLMPALPYGLAIVVAVAITTIVGILMYDLVVARLRNASMIVIVMVTISVGMFIDGVTLIPWAQWPEALPAFTSTVPFHLGRVEIAPQSVWVILMAAVLLVLLYLLNTRTLFGKKMTATATQPDAARLVGVSRASIIRWSFAISAVIGAIGGVFLSPIIPMNYASGMNFGLEGFVAAVLGGWGRSEGAVVGGLVLGIVENFAATFLPSGYQYAVTFLVLLLVLYWRPSGILGSSLVEGD